MIGMMTTDENAPRLVPAVVRAALILDQLAQADGCGGEGMTLSELVLNTKLPKSSVHGLCQTLVHLRLLKLTKHGRFIMGPKSVRWANAFLTGSDVVEAFNESVKAAGELDTYALTLSQLDGSEIVYLSCRNSAAPLGINFRIGMRVPAVFTATGKAILAALPPEDVAQYLPARWPKPITPTSVRSYDDLLREMTEVRAKGYSIDDGQLREGMLCIGAAICDPDFRPIAGIALSLMAAEVRPGAIEMLGGQIRHLAADVVERMGLR